VVNPRQYDGKRVSVTGCVTTDGGEYVVLSDVDHPCSDGGIVPTYGPGLKEEQQFHPAVGKMVCGTFTGTFRASTALYERVLEVEETADLHAISLAGKRDREGPAVTTVCSVGAGPSSFQDKVIRLRAEIESDGMHSSRLVDASCRGTSIPVTWGGAEKSSRLRGLIDTIFSKAGHPGALDKEITASFTGVFRWNEAHRPFLSIDLLDVTDIVVKQRTSSPFRDPARP
jgi:hypothetical protein